MGKRPIWVSTDEAEVLLTLLTTAILDEPIMTGFRRETTSAIVERLFTITRGLPDNHEEEVA